MESKSSHEIYLIVIASVLAAVIIGYNTLLAPKVTGIGVVYQNYDSSQEASQSAAVGFEPESSSEASPSDVVSSSPSEEPTLTNSFSNRTDPVSSAASQPSAFSSTTPAAPTPSVVNINTATAAQLETLPGIGEVKAQAIIAYRETYGPFRSVNELTLVKALGRKPCKSFCPTYVFEKRRIYLTFSSYSARIP